MCGIFGYVGIKKPLNIVVEGLKRLAYRGYDSAGIAGVQQGQLISCKEVGKIELLEEKLSTLNFSELSVAIGHTRWATHGMPCLVNAHPQLDSNKTLAIVHNGIIENHEILRNALKKQGVIFSSETDTEVVAQLIASLYQGDILEAVKETVSMLEGAYAIALIHKDFPDQIIAIAQHSPLVIGKSENETFLASDPHAFATHTNNVIFLNNNEIAIIKAGMVEVFDAKMNPITKQSEKLITEIESGESQSKGNFDHFTLKEIHYQPQSIRNAMNGRFLEDYGTACFENVDFDLNELIGVERILILACGTSWHAALVAASMLEDKARIPVQVEISSEFRYKNPILLNGTFVIAISQSGETADTLAAVREVKAKGVKVLAICNKPGSTLVRESDVTLLLHAGPEIGVCSTKAYTSQVIVLSLFTLLMARMRHMSKQEGQDFLHALYQLPEQVQAVLDQSKYIESIAKKYAKYDNFFFIGRRYMFPTSFEGALKLKEISYINANGYAAGEMKHGPIALLNPNCPVVALCANKSTFSKMVSNLAEVKARNAPLIAIVEGDEWAAQVEKIADDVIVVPNTIDELATILTTVVTQLLAYYIAKERGADIDQPRNLAKSVTVE